MGLDDPLTWGKQLIAINIFWPCQGHKVSRDTLKLIFLIYVNKKTKEIRWVQQGFTFILPMIYLHFTYDLPTFYLQVHHFWILTCKSLPSFYLHLTFNLLSFYIGLPSPTFYLPPSYFQVTFRFQSFCLNF